MTHDPLCPRSEQPEYVETSAGKYFVQCQCAFIQEIRADEREQAVKRLEEKARELSLQGKTRYWVDDVAAIRGGEQE